MVFFSRRADILTRADIVFGGAIPLLRLLTRRKRVQACGRLGSLASIALHVRWSGTSRHCGISRVPDLDPSVHACKMNSFLLFLLLVMATSGLFACVTSIVRSPYMDELFHIRQVQQYCRYNFTHWDPMITTLPGLYFISLMLLYPLSLLTDMDLISLCSPSVLRLTNVLLWIGNIWLMYGILVKLNCDILKVRSDTDKNKGQERPYGVQTVRRGALDIAVKRKIQSTMKEHCFITSLVVSFFPVLYFFTFLYYTDMASTFFVLLTYYCALSECHRCSAVAGLAAILCRQTNIIWVGFSAFVAALVTVSLAVDTALVKVEEDKPNTQTSFVDIVHLFLVQSVRRIKTLIGILWPYATVLLGFLIFIYINEGVVVGDKSSHQPALHLPQLLYFYAFSMVWSFSQFASLSNIRMALVSMSRRAVVSILITMVLMSLCFLAIKNFTIVHPYLRDDNRHLTFYVWRKLFARHPMLRYVWIPVYISSSLLIHTKLTHNCIMSEATTNPHLSHLISALWQIFFVLCTALPIVLQQLLEPRYFIVPYLMLRLHLPVQNPSIALSLEFILYVIVDIILLFLFLFVPFEWQHEPGVIQRFMW